MRASASQSRLPSLFPLQRPPSPSCTGAAVMSTPGAGRLQQGLFFSPSSCGDWNSETLLPQLVPLPRSQD